MTIDMKRKRGLLQLLLGAELAAVSALLLTAVVGTRGKTSVALTADHLLAVVLLGQGGKSGLNHSSSHLEEDLKGGLRGNSVGADGLGVLELLSGEDKALLVEVNVLSLLDHLLDVLHGLGGLNLKRDGVSLHVTTRHNHRPHTHQTSPTVTVLKKSCMLVTRDSRMSLCEQFSEKGKMSKRPNGKSPLNLPSQLFKTRNTR